MPAGRGGSGVWGAGRVTSVGSVGLTDSFCPRAPTTATPAVTPAAPRRNERLAGVPGDPGAYAVWSRGDSGVDAEASGAAVGRWTVGPSMSRRSPNSVAAP